MMMYQPIKFGCKKINGSADMVEIDLADQMSPHCDPDPECSNNFFFSHNTLASDDVSSDQVWFPRNQQFRKYS